MSEVKWSNLTTAAPPCRHSVEDGLEGCEEVLGGPEFAAMIRKAYAALYAPGATCHHTEVCDE